ncbi:hypothetical protein NBRGN_057_03410 [Nocardia brasiliensis NBRC 14402]|uniref:hypothetical protein n=1 Tax=Nocardia brasiliensis TaxID=37326 RepID=UPI0002E90E2F|nr:hypothetical protein [Nocardia brasiliensis]ASF11717.1 hypothetical protein CEQ30_35170 [Nocardia brasiliensis]GAJ82832.1 hypothetical protein NBRGN_057_03410 [Nocardia brasiliensis NBRC 14402]SUB09471.1 Uncharacterised protein [Nocardia brasiliensis]
MNTTTTTRAAVLGHTSIALLAAAAVAGGLVVGAGNAAAGTAGAGVHCLWAGTSHPQGATVVAGGQSFRCETDRGAASWSRGPADNRPSTVPNPGAYTRPAGLFSPGARQPGTEYNDYCVGSQLIEGNEDIYQVVAARDGSLQWKAAGPISQWKFDPVTPRPGPSSRSVSLCIDGNLT